MTKFISIDGNYSILSLALWQDNQCIKHLEHTQGSTSAHLIQLVDWLLSQAQLTLQDLDFIAANHGPGAFISLRVVLATVNGLNFARQIPLIGIDGLEALHHAAENRIVSSPDQQTLIVSLLNAYGNDVYVLVKQAHHTEHLIKDCIKIDTLLSWLASKYQCERVLFVGNGAQLHTQTITAQQKASWHIMPSLETEAVSQQIGRLAYLQWQADKITHGPLQPFYLKTQFFAVRS